MTTYAPSGTIIWWCIEYADCAKYVGKVLFFVLPISRGCDPRYTVLLRISILALNLAHFLS